MNAASLRRKKTIALYGAYQYLIHRATGRPHFSRSIQAKAEPTSPLSHRQFLSSAIGSTLGVAIFARKLRKRDFSGALTQRPMTVLRIPRR